MIDWLLFQTSQWFFRIIATNFYGTVYLVWPCHLRYSFDNGNSWVWLIPLAIWDSTTFFFQPYGTYDKIAIMMFLYELCWSFGLIFVCSELCQRISSAFDGVDHKITQLRWYLLPIELWKILPTIIINTQMPVTFGCFGCISCERVTFKNVSKTFNSSYDTLFSKPWMLLLLYASNIILRWSFFQDANY